MVFKAVRISLGLEWIIYIRLGISRYIKDCVFINFESKRGKCNRKASIINEEKIPLHVTRKVDNEPTILSMKEKVVIN